MILYVKTVVLLCIAVFKESFIYILQIIERDQHVAFIGISNWALDPAKMNRGVMVTRGDPDEDELVISAK